MPKPRTGEKKENYISRCISYLIKKEGKKQDQAIAICHSYWERKNEDKLIEKMNLYINESLYVPSDREIKDVQKELAKKLKINPSKLLYKAVQDWRPYIRKIELMFDIIDPKHKLYKSSKLFQIWPNWGK